VKRLKWQVLLGLSLLTLSALVYSLHYLLFHDPRYIEMFFVCDLAFVFIEVLLVTLIIDEILGMREKRSLLRKLNMVIGAFFSQVGTVLIGRLAAFDLDFARIRDRLTVTDRWTAAEFSQTSRQLQQYPHRIDVGRSDLAGLKEMLLPQRAFLLSLLENQNLLEHERFTEVLMSVFHLLEELAARTSLSALPEPDLAHIARDMERAYRLLIRAWLDYMQHLRDHYPYLFSFALRTNPFDPDAVVEVRSPDGGTVA
jgi:hypothetical protein